MTTRTIILLAALALPLAACGGKGDDKLGDQARQAADNRADALDAAAHDMSGAQKDVTKAQAEAVRAEGKARAKAIDDADVDTTVMNDAQKTALINGN